MYDKKPRVKPVLLIAIVFLLCLWIMYPTIRSRALSDESVEFTYRYVNGELVEVQ